MSLDVFVERVRSFDPLVSSKLAQHLAAKYNISAAEARAGLANGHFCVRSGVDRATADQVVRELTQLGAECALYDETGHRVSGGQGAVPKLPPLSAGGGRPSTSPGGNATVPADPWASLSSLSLANLDDDPSQQPTVAAKRGTGTTNSATIGGQPGAEVDAEAALAELADTPVMSKPTKVAAAGGSAAPPPMPKRAKAPSAPRPPAKPVDQFAPPDAGPALGVDALSFARPVRAASPSPGSDAPLAAANTDGPIGGPSTAPGPTDKRATSVIAAPRAPTGLFGAAAPAEANRSHPLAFLRDERPNFVAGVVLAFLLGLLPALIYATRSEASALATLDQKLAAHYNAVETPDDWEALAPLRTAILGEKQREQSNVNTTMLFIWAVLGGGVAFLWFRVLDWDKLLR